MSYEQVVYALKQLQNEHFSIAFDIPPDDPFSGVAQEILTLAASYAKRIELFAKIHSLSAELSKGVLLEDVLSRAYQAFRTVIPYSRLACALISEDGASLQLVWAHSSNPGNMRLTKGFQAALANSSLLQILADGEPRIINDLAVYLKRKPDSTSTRLMLAEGIRSSLTCPLVVDGKPVGFLFFSSKRRNTYQGAHLDSFKRIAQLISIYIDKSRLYQDIHDQNRTLQSTQEDLRQKSMHDTLTGLYNRGAILDLVQNAIHQAALDETRVGIMMIDVDYFKRVNDIFGHLAGDEALRNVAHAIRSAVRDYDRVGRYGGEEFLLLLSAPSDAAVDAIAARIHEKVGEIAPLPATRPVHLSVSIGIAVKAARDVDIDQLIEAADNALYRAKEAGRGCSIRHDG
ncbi:sensor domain-containing diguanylate cyclase [Paludibacterium purpuratum]|uniref:sensor domain-containing diguanylate cyclase n=1 Tax=Paludibacterium purpuratum TaxID=1144873 RepID=UPI00141523FE|nr:sensor domain-containing diguanylate cyclase [Paludibacterium purpuratum]